MDKTIIGQKFNRLTVIAYDDESKKYICKCDCGNEHKANKHNLVFNLVKSCGCLKKEGNHITYGFSHTRIDNIYRSIISRCYCPNCKSYKNYGSKGITVCDEWRLDKIKFFDWAFKNGYSDTLTIDRIDNSKGYCPENCRWITYKQQANNKTNNLVLCIDGVSHTVAEWADISNVQAKTIYARLKRNWEPKRAVFQKVTK